MWVQPVVEDLLQEAVLTKMVEKYRPDLDLYPPIGKKGNTYIKTKLKAFNDASEAIPHIILTDLDDIDCAPTLVNEWINYQLSPKLLFRIAEKEVESWIMADRNRFASFMGIPVSKVPSDTQVIANPKLTLINFARKSKKKKIKDIIPVGSSKVGPGYNLILEEFVINYWNVDDAAMNNSSLLKAIERLKVFLK